MGIEIRETVVNNIVETWKIFERRKKNDTVKRDDLRTWDGYIIILLLIQVQVVKLKKS